MTMSKGDSRYEVAPRRVLFAEKGTEERMVELSLYAEEKLKSG
jgi:hypothetical protein